jgi:predicted Zn-dependent protease
MNVVTVTLRRLGATALLALLGWGHAPALALDLPGAAPQAPAVLPDYEPQRLNAIFMTNKDRPMTSQWVHRDKLDSQLAALRMHAGNPTLRFNSADQQAQARRDAILLAATMAQVTAPPETKFELLLRAGIALSVAHNLGAPEAAALADARFERLLQKVPELPAGLLEYGIHLTNTNRPNEALVPLRRALAQGNDDARWPLAMSLAALGQRSDAVAELETLQARSPAASLRYPLAATLTALRAAPG